MVKTGRIILLVIAAMYIPISASFAAAQNPDADALAAADTLKVPAGQKMTVEGTIVNQLTDNLILRGTGGALYKVVLSGAEIKERKANPFRGAKDYGKQDLIKGLFIEVKGAGDGTGSIAAREIRLKNDDMELARTMDARVMPVENSLKETQTRLGETEQNAQKMSGQIRELAAITDTVRDSAKSAQSAADGAMVEAKGARSQADSAKAGVKAANERITSLDAYDVKNVTTIAFKAGSAVIQEKDKPEFDKIAEHTRNEKGFLIEVTGFASSDGDEAYNRRLSQKRAEAVIQYLAENYEIPLRRFIMPMGYGEKQPLADNTTLAGRRENRRVEVRILVSKGQVNDESLAANPNAGISEN
jgi:outer membrane protein OmpA-like peptidoglycan-associated protein